MSVVGTASGDTKEYFVSSAAGVTQLTDALRPGDVVVMTNGIWMDQRIVFRGRGTTTKPITLRAQTPGHVVLAGNSWVSMEGEHLVVSGLFSKSGDSTNEGISIKGQHCRLTDTAIVEGSYKFFVRIWGAETERNIVSLPAKLGSPRHCKSRSRTGPSTIASTITIS